MYAGVGTIEEAEAKAAQNEKTLGKKGGAGFTQMSLVPELQHAVVRMGYHNPTPVQRKAIPPMLVGNDIVAMARTGSGKTAAYLLPTLQRLRGHSKIVGTRGLILTPTRELALQILRVAKRLCSYAATCPAALLASSVAQDPSNTLHRQANPDASNPQSIGTLRCCAIVGGTSLEAQFAEMTTNPDIIVATPGRVLHIMEETSLKMLSNIEVLVMDEADRLFEMGLQPQIVQILGKVHESCQRALFSATMPSILAEFTSAGLHNPITIRLDAEMKISDKLKHSSFLVRSEEKIAALIYLLKKVIGVKTDVDAFLKGRDDHEQRKERKAKRTAMNQKRGRDNGNSDDDDDDDGDSEQEDSAEIATGKPRRDCGPQCLVFVESKHHVDLFEKLLEAYLISCSAIHGQMDQEARKTSVMRFAKRKVSVMVVTDVAARGLDIPLLDNVINFSFPFNPKLFIHRVGRVARAGRTGAAYSIMTTEDMPYYIDLMRFLDHPIQHTLPEKVNMDDEGLRDDGTDGYYGRIPDAALRVENDYLMKLKKNNLEVAAALKVADHSHDKYTKTKKKASGDAVREMKRARKEALDKAAAAKMLGAGDSDSDLDDEYIRPPTDTGAVTSYDFYATPIHPMLLAKLSDDVIASDAAKLALRNFKSKEGGLIEVQHAADNKGERLFTMRMPVLGQSVSQSSKTENSAPVVAPKLSLAESMLLKAQQRKAGLLDSSTNTIAGKKKAQAAAAAAAAEDPMMEGITIEYNAFATNSSGNAANGGKARNILNQTTSSKYRDANFFMDDDRKEMHDDQHYTVKDATIDMAPESAEEAAAMRNVFAWNKKKNRYVKVAVNDAKAMLKGIKNEAGKSINFKKDKLDAYAKWTKKSNMRIQDCGEEEDDGAVVRARAAVESGTYAAAEDADDTGAATEKQHLDSGSSMRQLFGKQQKKKPLDAFGNKRKEGTVTESKWASRKHARKERRETAKNEKILSSNSDYVDISDPNNGRKVRIGRKQKKLTKDGLARSFDDLVKQKKKRQEQRQREGKGASGNKGQKKKK